MKRNAVARIVIYSLIILVLVGILQTGIGIGQFVFQISDGNYTTGAGSVDAKDVSSLEIDWVAGSVTIQTGAVEEITFSDTGADKEQYEMGYYVKNGTLHISYNAGGVNIGFGSYPSKDLTVTVPEDWNCRDLELDGASLNIDITGLSVGELNIDGASNELAFTGSLDSLDCDGASNKLTVICTNSPKEIDLDGASVTLNLTLPEDCGYRAEVEGLSCTFQSDYDHEHRNGEYWYGDESCEINADGVSCTIKIHKP